MTLTEMYSRPLKDVLEECNIVEQKIHTNPTTGEVMSIELKFVPKEKSGSSGSQPAEYDGPLSGTTYPSHLTNPKPLYVTS